MEFKKGAIIKIKQQFLAPDERDIPYMVLEDRGDRVLVQDLREYSDQPFLGTYCWPKDTMYLVDNNTADQAAKAFDKDLFDDLLAEQQEQM